MSDDSILIAGVELLRDYNKADAALKDKLTADLLALGIPVSLHGALFQLMSEADGINKQINAEIAAKAAPVE